MIERREFLYLNLVKFWYDMIAAGIKKEEYREIKPYYDARFLNKKYEKVIFVNGYSKKTPKMCFEIESISIDSGIEEWGGDPDYPVYVIKLGKRLW